MFILTDAAHSSGILESWIHLVIPEIIGLIEIMGIAIIIVGTIKAFYMYAMSMFTHKHYPIKLALGNSLALGLEFKMGAEILKTVTIRTIDEIMILGAIIVLRALLSVLIHYEVKSEKEHSPNNEDISKSEY